MVLPGNQLFSFVIFTSAAVCGLLTYQFNKYLFAATNFTLFCLYFFKIQEKFDNSDNMIKKRWNSSSILKAGIFGWLTTCSIIK